MTSLGIALSTWNRVQIWARKTRLIRRESHAVRPSGRMSIDTGPNRSEKTLAVTLDFVGLLERGSVDPLDQRLLDRSDCPELDRVRAHLVPGRADSVGRIDLIGTLGHRRCQ